MSDPIDFWEDPLPLIIPDEKPRCYGCHRELCPELDHFWDRDGSDYWGRHCVDCRDKRLGRPK